MPTRPSRSSTHARRPTAAGSSPTPATPRAGSLRQKDPAITASRNLAFWAYQLGAVEGGAVVAFALRDAGGAAARGGCRSTPSIRRRAHARRGPRLLPALARAPPRPRLRDRRRGGQGRRPGAARRARLDVQGAPLGDRLQVPARGAHDPAERASWSRSGGPARPRRSRSSSRCSSAARPSASPRSTTRTRCAQGRAAGRHGDRAQGRRRHPRGGRAGARAAPRGAPRVDVPDRLPGVLRRPLVRLEGESDTFCTNVDCPAQRAGRHRALRRRAARWTSRASASSGRTSSPRPGSSATSATSTPSTCERRARASRASASSPITNLLAAIEASKERPLANLLVGLNIRHLGGAGAQVLARAFGHLDRILDASMDEIAATEGIGPMIAASVHAFFAIAANREVIEKLRAAGVNFQGPDAPGRPADPGRHCRSSSPAPSRAGPARRPRRPSRPGRQVPGQRLEEDDRRRGRRRARRGEGDQGRGARRPDPRRGRLRPPPRARRASPGVARPAVGGGQPAGSVRRR